MKPDMPLDYAEFQLSPKQSRCELFVSSNGNTEKLASGLVKPFVTHLKVAEEQVALSAQSIRLDVEKIKNAETWFTKGTLERFVRFVSTPEVLEMANTYDAEMSQLEAARKIYSQGMGDQSSGASGGEVARATASAADATKKELIRAIDVRLDAVRQDLTAACARTSAAGFNPDTVSELQQFSDRFGAHRLKEACENFISLYQRRPDLVKSWKLGSDDRAIRSSTGSDMSIDDPNEDHQSKPSTFKQIEKFQKKEEETESAPTIQVSQPIRRLSVQDRINMFENKQKESSPTTSITNNNSSTSAGKPVIPVKQASELRRLSSEVSSAAAEKAVVLRRWSGVSDMSLDLSGDFSKKDVESPIRTPSSGGVVSENKEVKGLQDTASSGKNSSRLNEKDDLASRVGVFSSKKEEGNGLKQGIISKDEVGSANSQSKFSHGRVEQFGLKEQAASFREKLKISLGGEGIKDKAGIGVEDSGDFELGDQATQTEVSNKVKDSGFVDQQGTRSQFGATLREKVEIGSKSKVSPVSQVHAQSFTEQLSSISNRKIRETSLAQTKEVKGDSFCEVEEFEKQNLTVSGKKSNKEEELETQKMKYPKQGFAPETVKKMQSGRDKSGSFVGNSKPVFSGKNFPGGQDSYNSTTTILPEQVQRVRQTKGNQELNDELQMKANELEKLFAEHRLRIPGDQSTSLRKNKPSEVPTEVSSSLALKKPAKQNTAVQLPDVSKFIGTPGSSSTLEKSTSNEDYGSAVKNFSELSFSDDSRGNAYARYMQKRDAKLREEWGTKRAEKEAQMKSMQDSLEHSRTELKAKFSGSADRIDPVSGARRRAEKLRSFNMRSSAKREEQPMDYLQSEEDEGPEFRGQKLYGQDRGFSDTSLGDSSIKNNPAKKLLPNRNLVSSTPRTSAAQVPRASFKGSNSVSARRRAQSENPLAQSVPNFSDLRKENTKPSSGVSKTTARSQQRNYARSKSTNEETPSIKEEKPRRSQFLRKGSANPVEFKDLSDLSPDDVILGPIQFDEEQTDPGIQNKFSKNLESKSFLRKGSGIGPGSGATAAKLKASMVSSEAFRNEESDELVYEQEESVEMLKEEIETMETEDCAEMDIEKSRLSQESEKFGDSGSGDGDALGSLSQGDPASVTELPPPSVFHAIQSVQQESPGESPVSWNSHMHNTFSYPHETSDIDAYVDSPMGSPASWNSHSLNQTDADAARMRKKWGSANKPFFVANSSHNQSRKDMTKGFKRLLKFGRKNRGSESLVDWISATTSEGDDDTEDSRDPANRSSDDLRKSRMGFSQSHHSDDVFNEGELYNEQVQAYSSIPEPPANFKLRDREDHLSGSSLKAPRSFFSLSSFRSKGSESKPR